MVASPETVLVETRGRVMVITLNRPEVMNAIDPDMADGFLDAVERLDGDAGVDVGVLSGAGGNFCTGMDLKAFATRGARPRQLREFHENGARKPIIAAIEGNAMAGGFELALACDVLVAARGARFGIPEVRVGLFASGGALYRLPERVPFGVAMEMALTADPISAEQAQSYGLVSRLTEAGGAVDEAVALAERIARNAPLALALSKRVIRSSRGMTESEARALQDELKAPVLASDDAKEGPRAFAEKRPPRWTGR